MANPQGSEPGWNPRHALGALATIVAAGTVATAVVLATNLFLRNRSPELGGAWSAGELADLLLAMAWVALVTNAALVAAVFAGWLLLRRLRPGWAEPRQVLWVSGLLAGHLAWALFNRFSLVQRTLVPPLFWAPEGLLQLFLVLASAGALVVAGVCAGRRRWGIAAAAAAGCVLLAAGVLARNAAEEVRYRTYPLEQVHAAVVAPSEAEVPSAADPGAGTPLIVLAFDGWGWDVALPLLQAGKLPNVAELVRRGAVGYLDNAGHSYSPRIWATVFTGRPVQSHGVLDFLALRLRGGRTLPDFALQDPAVDSFYGLKQLLRAIPSLGLWELVRVDASFVRTKRLWTVASEAGRRVAIVNALTTTPARPVNGAMVDLQHRRPTPEAFFPPELFERWTPFGKREKHRSLEYWQDVVEAETALALELFEEHEIELGLYYNKSVDYMGHHHWHFYAVDDWITTSLPEDLPDAEWAEWVVENADTNVIGSYAALDASLGRFRARYPDATFLLVSDHAWTFSGYAHYGTQNGLIIVSGPRVRAGATLEDVHIEDVAPTALALLGIPVSDELEGRVVQEALAEPIPVRRIASYGDPEDRLAPEPMSEEELRALSELGYVE